MKNMQKYDNFFFNSAEAENYAEKLSFAAKADDSLKQECEKFYEYLNTLSNPEVMPFIIIITIIILITTIFLLLFIIIILF
jgi:hypothetical protein